MAASVKNCIWLAVVLWHVIYHMIVAWSVVYCSKPNPIYVPKIPIQPMHFYGDCKTNAFDYTN